MKSGLTLFEKFYANLPGRFQRIIDKYFYKRNNGEYFSYAYRKLYKDVFNIQVGIGSYGCFDVNQFPRGTTIGNYCSIAPRVHFLFSNHPMYGASTHPIFYNSLLGYVPADRINRVRLDVGNDVWIGADVTITQACTSIETGAIIGAGSVVTHNVPEYAVVAGNPARIIRYRFDYGTQGKLKESKWFELLPEELAQFLDLQPYPEEFAKAIIEYRKFNRKLLD